MKLLHFSRLAAVLLSVSAFGQNPKAPVPDHRDVAYDDKHPAQKLDVYLAESDQPAPVIIYIHGGGWRAGSKNKLPALCRQIIADGWASVVSVEYRFTDVKTHPAQVNDCVRAIQFVRTKAKEWNLDPGKIGVTGGSAGAHLSLWIAVHDDLAEPESGDPVEQQSSRVSCAIGYAGPTDWSLLAQIEHQHPAYRQLLGYEPGTPAEEMDAAKKAHVSPISFASKDDPPILIVHGDADVVVPVKHATDLHAKMKKAGGKSDLYIVKGGNHGVAGAGGPKLLEKSIGFMKKHLLAGTESEPAAD
ncbi:MAG: alpha/beta hydrolase [Verrucomicrobiales bacterium]|nr:alpha/beta hydrolase [Verrucomicrobiales bacterium]